MADLGGYEGVRQAPLPGLPDLPGRPIRRRGGGLCPTVFHRTEADGGVSSHPAPAVRCCLHPHRRLQPLRLLVAEGALLRPPPPLQLGHNSSLHNGRSMELATGKRRGPPPPLPSLWSARVGGVPGTGDPEPRDPALQEMAIAPLLPPEEGRVENFCSVPPLAPSGTQNFIRAVSFFLRVPRGRGWQCARPRLHIPIPLSLRQWAAGSGPRTRCLLPRPLPSRGARWVLHHTLRPHFETLCLSKSGPWAPLRCPTAGTSMSPLVPLVRPLGAWLELPRPSRWLLRTIRLGYAIQFARRPPKFRGNRFTSVLSQDAPVLRAEVAVLLAKDAIQPAPPAEMESGLYKGPYFIVPKKHGGLHPIWDLRVLNRALVKLPFKMLTQRRLFQCVRPFDWVAAIDLKDAYFHVSILPAIPLCVQRASIPVGPPLRAPQPVGASGQPGKEQTLPYAEDLFSRQGVGLGQPHSTSLRGACSVNAEMPGVSPAQEGGSTETFSEAPGAYGILSRYHAARIASYETASALASRPSPEMGMAPRHIPGLTHPVLPSHLQPMVGSCLSSGRSSPRASIQARCCFNRRHVQRARSRGALDRAPAAVAYQLPRVAGSIACSAPLQNAATREAYTGPFGQHCDRCIHQPPGRSTLPSHVATRPPSPPLESEASEVASRRSCPRRAQSCSRRALTSARPSGRMATPPRGTPAELETLRGRSGRPVCLPGHVSLPVVFLPVRGDPRYRCAGMQLASGLT